jgi:hypothetical protein
MAEAARLAAVAVDLERRVRERARDEARDHHPVLAALARADGVEEPDDHAVETALLVVREREELVHRLRVGVRPAPLRRRAVHAARVLGERRLLAVVAVDLGGRGDEHPLAEAVAVLEHGLRPLDVRDERVHGLLDDQADADGGGEVVDDVCLVHQLVYDRMREHGVDDEVEIAPFLQVGDVVVRACREIVQGPHLAAVLEQALAEVRADEPRAARHEHLPPLHAARRLSASPDLPLTKRNKHRRLLCR